MFTIFVADIDQDIDDLIAIEYLKLNNSINGVVLDPMPITQEGRNRVRQIEGMGIKIYDQIPKETQIVLNGGAFTKIARFVKGNKLEWMVANGGFVGNNIVTDPLAKFKDKEFCRTYNPNLDPLSAEQVINSVNIKHKCLVSKNVCHDERNTIKYLWKNLDFIKKYNLKDSKRLHDLLMCFDGLKIIKNEETVLEYKSLDPIHKGLKGKYTEWGSIYGTKVLGSIRFK